MRGLALLLLGGCESLFPLTEDAPATADAPTCTMPEAVFERFDNPTNPCANIGITNVVGATVVAAGSQLQVTPMPNAGSTVGGCFSTVTMAFAGGAFLETTQLISGPSEYMFFKARWEDEIHSSTLTVGGGGTELIYSRENDGFNAKTALTPMTHWWRMRPRDDRQAIVAETSRDGITWTVFATDESTPPDRVFIELAIGTFASEDTPSTTIVEGINVCP